MAQAFCPGYSNEPFATLVQEYPAEDVLPPTAGPLSPAGAATSPLGNGKSRLDALPHVQAQRTGTAPDERAYLECVDRKAGA